MNTIGKSLFGCAVTIAMGFIGMGMPQLANAQGPDGAYCASNDGRYARCAVPWRDAILVEQASKARCIRGQTWGFDRNGIWVDQGCRGQFAPARGGRPHDWNDGSDGRPGWNDHSSTRIRCESRGNSYQMCPVRIRRDDDVRMVNQISGADCQEGRSWGWQREGIWVNRGCRADFVVRRR